MKCLLFSVLLLVILFSACTKKNADGISVRILDELKKEDIKVGTGAEAKDGKDVEVHYVGTLFTTGRKFDSSLDRNQPFSFRIGSGEVIKGWDYGVAGMKIGGKRKLTIPPELAYGSRGAGEGIPPDSTLVFEIELLKVD